MHKEKSVLRLSNKRELLFKVPQAGLPPLRMYYLKSDFTTDIAHTGQMAYQKIKEPLWEGFSFTFPKHSTKKPQVQARKLFRKISYSFLHYLHIV